MRDSDLPGGFLSKTQASSLAECRAACAKNKECAAFTLLPVKLQCSLKNSEHGSVAKETWAAKNGAVSRLMACSELQSLQFLQFK